MLVKSAHFLEMYVSLHVVVAATSVMFTSFTLLASAALMIELMIFDKYIYFCVFQ